MVVVGLCTSFLTFLRLSLPYSSLSSTPSHKILPLMSYSRTLLLKFSVFLSCIITLESSWGWVISIGIQTCYFSFLKKKHKTVKQTRPSFDSQFPSSYYLYSRSVCSAQLLINSEYSLFVTVLLSFSLKCIPVKLLPYCSTKIAFIKVTGELYVAGYGGGYREINRIVWKKDTMSI